MPAVFDGCPDDWWAGHDWEYGWGAEPAPLLVSFSTSLPGATFTSRELTQRVSEGDGAAMSGAQASTRSV
jgi:hypothetical protein